MTDSHDYREAALVLRQEAAKPGDLADRARMIIVAERFELLAKELETRPATIFNGL